MILFRQSIRKLIPVFGNVPCHSGPSSYTKACLYSTSNHPLQQGPPSFEFPSVCSFSSSSTTPPWTVCSLSHRCLVSVSGSEAASFLQGLMTNDINILLEEDRRSIYCMFLNVRGRIIFDTLLSRGFSEDQFLLEVDNSIAATVRKHLMMYKVRRKVKVEMMKDVLSVFVTFKDTLDNPEPDKPSQTPLLGSTYCGYHSEQTVPQQTISSAGDGSILTIPDPRLSSLGHRLILPSSISSPLPHLPPHSHLADSSLYLAHRYRLGVAEGTGDIPPDNCFPVEYNLDYLNGVSFHKGCYIGQELTARTHHTGVVRKRILPIEILDSGGGAQVEPESPIKNEKGKTVGKLRNVEGSRGIGLMRLKESEAAGSLSVEGVRLGAKRPSWWPGDSK